MRAPYGAALEHLELVVHLSEVLGDVSSLLVNDLVALLHDHRLAVRKHCVHPLHNGLDHSHFKFRLVPEEAICELLNSRSILSLSLSSWLCQVAACRWRYLPISRLYFNKSAIEVLNRSSIDLMSFIGRNDLHFLREVLALQLD